MQLNVRWTHNGIDYHGTLTTEHAASCYGLPVLVVGGNLIDPHQLAGSELYRTDVVDSLPPNVFGVYTLDVIDRTLALQGSARRAGYNVVIG